MVVIVTTLFLDVAIKQQMQKDIDEAGKTARLAKSKFEELDRDVWFISLMVKPTCDKYISFRAPFI